MNTMTKKGLGLGLVALATASMLNTAVAQSTKKTQFTGAARTWVTNSNLDVQTKNSTDTVSSTIANAGLTALDFGINLQPVENTEIHGVFRITNKIGAMWGGSTELLAREAWVKGVAFKKFRYQLGDLNLRMTPFTMYNFEEDMVVNEAEIFGLMRDVMRYENFYDGNTWRQQGLAMDFGWDFENQPIEKLTFKPFISRWRSGGGSGAPNRFIGGGTIGIKQSENLRFGLNSINTFELEEVEGDTTGLKIPVYSMDFEYLHKTASYTGGVSGEIGGSQYHYTGGDTIHAKLRDMFYEVGVFYVHNKSGVSSQLRYREVGPNFRSPSAQSRRYNFSGEQTFFPTYTNFETARPLITSDLMSDQNFYNVSFDYVLDVYNPALTMAQPYGDATPNRKGILLDVLYSDENELIETEINFGMLSEVVGTGTTDLKKFMVTKVAVDADLGQLLNWSNHRFVLTGEASMESASRGGTDDYDEVNMSNLMWGAGLSFEVIEKFDILGGVKSISASGFEYVGLRDTDNIITDYLAYDVDYSTMLMSGGLRYRFGDNTNLSAFLQQETFKNNMADTDDNFAIGQFHILFFTRF